MFSWELPRSKTRYQGIYTPKLPCDMFISFQISIIQKHLQKVVNIKKMVLYFLKRYRVPLSCWVTHNVAKSSYIRRKRKTLETVFFLRDTLFSCLTKEALFSILYNHLLRTSFQLCFCCYKHHLSLWEDKYIN